jgi:HEAT repeat protein
MSADSDGRLALLVALLGGGDVAHPALSVLAPEARQRLRAEAMAHVRTLPGDDATRAFTALLGAVDPATQAGVIHALADRGDRAAAPALLAALDTGDETVRLAALEALGAVGTVDALDTLTAAAASEDSATRQAARKSLERLHGDGVDEALVARLRKAEPPVQAEILRALAGRGSTGAVVPVLRQARSEEAAVRDEAYRALAMLAGPGEVKDLLRLVERADTRGERDQAVKALVAAARRTPPGQPPAGPVLAALAEAQSQAVVEALSGALAGIGDATALPELRARAVHPDAGLRSAAVRAMADWPTADAREDLRTLAAWLPEADERAAALDGYVRLLRADTGMDEKEKATRYVEAMAVAADLGAKRRILAGLGDLKDAAALDALDGFAGDEAMGTEARAAAEKVRRGFYTATASHASAEAAQAFDNNIDSRWTTGVVQGPGMWFELDLSRAAAIRGIVLDTTRSAGDFPRGYAVHVANEPGQWGAPVAEGQATTPVLEITFEPVRARYLRVVQTGESADHWWSIDELRVLPK